MCGKQLKEAHNLESFRLTSIYQSIRVNLFNLADNLKECLTFKNLLEQKDSPGNSNGLTWNALAVTVS